MAEKKIVEDKPRNIIAQDYSDMTDTYANQSLLKMSGDDVSMVFGVNTVDDTGKDKIQFKNMIRMSHSHFEKLIANCNEALKQIKSHESK